MFALWFQAMGTLCLLSPALCTPESSAVRWKNVGESITIQCRSSDPRPDYATLVKGLNKETEILFLSKQKPHPTIDEDYTDRLQLDSNFPSLDFLLTNVTPADTGPYWCVYKKFISSELRDVEGRGSVLLVVTDSLIKTSQSVTPEGCEQPNKSLVLTSMVISGAVLLGFIVALVAFITVKTKNKGTVSKPSAVSQNDVYEDMRGTIRR